MNFLIVFLGAGLGGALRHGVNAASLKLGWTEFPAATLIVNLVGCFVMGLLVELLALKAHLPASVRLFLTTGLLGGFTTFSTFALDTTLLAERGKAAVAALYVLASVGGGLAALLLALALVRASVRG